MIMEHKSIRKEWVMTIMSRKIHNKIQVTQAVIKLLKAHEANNNILGVN